MASRKTFRLPRFKSKFLEDLCRCTEKRTKALKHHGEFTWESKQPDEFEWITFYFTPLIGPYTIVMFDEGNQISLFLRSSRRKDRGKILLELENIIIVDDAESILEVFEATIGYSSSIQSDVYSQAHQLIEDAWRMVEKKNNMNE